MTRPPLRPAPPPGLADTLAGRPLSLELLARADAPANTPPAATPRAPAHADGHVVPAPTDMSRAPVSPAPADMSRTPAPPADSPGAPAPADMFDAPELWLVPPPRPAPPIAPPEALAELDALLARPDLDDPALARLAALAPQVPGRLRAVVAALAASDSPAALAGLLTVPDAPGALPAACRLLQAGRARRLSARPGHPGPLAPISLALEFRPSRARPFPDLLRRAQRLAADPSGALRLDALRVDDRVRYRLSFWPAELEPRPRAALARAAAPDLVLLHARLSRLRGARLWLNGFALEDGGPVSPAAQAHLLRAWLAWSEGPAR